MLLPKPLDQQFQVAARRIFSATNLKINWQKNYLNLPMAWRLLEDHFWQASLRQQPQTSLFNGTLCQLRAMDFTETPIKITLGPIQFKTHLFTMLKGNSLNESYLTNPTMIGLGVSVVIITADQQLLIIKRSDKVASNPGQFDLVGGHIDPELHQLTRDSDTPTPNPFIAITTEMVEELALHTTQIARLEGIGMVVNRLTTQPELIFRCVTTLSADETFHQARHAQDRQEYSHLIRLPNDSETLDKICLKYAHDFSPSGLGGLWLHYLLLLEQKQAMG